MLLPPENTLFVRGATPLLLLARAPVHDALPRLTDPGETLPRCEGWSIAPRLTLCVVDGPGDHGVLIPALTAPVLGAPVPGATATEPADMADWCEDVERAGGAVLLSLDHLPPTLDWPTLLTPAPTTRGGFTPTLT